MRTWFIHQSHASKRWFVKGKNLAGDRSIEVIEKHHYDAVLKRINELENRIAFTLPQGIAVAGKI